jgi:hypothetical protein
MYAGMDYVSCSPFRVPMAKVAAAQAHIEKMNSECMYIYVIVSS